jgi:UDP-glucuronate 4-epimerase
MITLLENKLGKKAEKRFLPMQPGDVYATYADITDTQRDYGFSPVTHLEQGLETFATWYKDFYGA